MKVKVPNDLCCEEMYQWMRDTYGIGTGRYTEWIAIVNRPFRTYDFRDEQDAMLFMLRWL